MTDIPNPANGTEEEKVETPETPETPAPNPEPAPEQPAPAPSVDYEKKFADSTREAQILAGQVKDQAARIEQLTKQHPPTDQELKDAYPEWDQMLPHEQRMAKDNLALRRRQAAADLKLAEMEAQRKWEADLMDAKRNFPTLVGREAEFQAFVMKPTHRTTPVDVLAKAFLSDHTQPAPAPTPPASPHGAINRGSSGPAAPSNKPKWTAAQVQQIQKTDSKRYREMLLSGEFDDIDE